MALLVLVIPAIALRIAIRVLYGRRPLASTDPMHTLLTMASTMMFVLAAIGATAGVWIVIVPLPIIVAVVVVMVVDRSRLAEHRALLASLADVLLLVDRDCVGVLASVATAADFAGLVPPPQATTESPPRINRAATRA